MKYPTLYFRKYLAKVINKIYIEHVLINIYKNLLTDEFNNLKYKSLFFIVRLLLMNGMFNYLDFFAKFLKKNISFELNSPNEIIEYFVSHLSFDQNKLYLCGFESEEKTYKINNESNNLELYNLTNTEFNQSIFNYIINLMFLCVQKSKNLDDIIIINKLIKIIFMNIIPIENKNIEPLIEFLMKYLNNINITIEKQGYQNSQTNLRKLFEILYYTNFYINIKENIINEKKEYFLVGFYHFIIIGFLQLFPDNFNSKEYEFLNILPNIYSYISNLYELQKENNENKEEIKSIISNIALLMIDSSKSNYIKYNIKNKSLFNHMQLAIFYIFSFLENIESKNFLSFIILNLVKFLNIEEFKLDHNNIDINSLNFILFNIFIQIIIKEESFLKNDSKKSNEFQNHLKKNSSYLFHIYNIIKDIFNNINKADKNCNIKIQKIIYEHEQKIHFINEHLNFHSKTHLIDFYKNKNENLNDDKIKILSGDNKDDINANTITKNYKLWLKYVSKISIIIKSKKNNNNYEGIKKYDDLLKSSFSFYETKIEKYIGLIKSEEIENNDINLFNQFLSNIGDIFIIENKFTIRYENSFNRNIIHLDKNDSNDILFVLIKDNFVQCEESILNAKFIIYIKPLILKSVYSIKITKNQYYKNKNKNIKDKINIQINNDINEMFSDLIIINFNKKGQVDYFFKIIDLLFYYSLLENLIDCSRDLINK